MTFPHLRSNAVCISLSSSLCGYIVISILIAYVLALMGLLGALDFLFVYHACQSIITRGASVQLVFGFEVCHLRITSSKFDFATMFIATLCMRKCFLSHALQYAILLTMVLTMFIKYILHTVDLQSENPWDNKAVYMLYTELFTGNRVLLGYSKVGCIVK